MKFKCQISIDLPREKVVALWDNVDNLQHWQDGFVSFEQLEGEKGTVGAVARMNYDMPSGKFGLIETILVADLPNEFVGEYSMSAMTNTMKNTFTETSPNQTLWEVDIEYTVFNGIMVKIMAWIAPGVFKRQTQKWLDQFKAFAEQQENN